MNIQFDKAEMAAINSSIRKYFREELEHDIGELQAKLLLDYFLKEIAPFAYNKGVSDAETYLMTRMEDLRNICFQEGLTYWRQKRKSSAPKK